MADLPMRRVRILTQLETINMVAESMAKDLRAAYGPGVRRVSTLVSSTKDGEFVIEVFAAIGEGDVDHGEGTDDTAPISLAPE